MKLQMTSATSVVRFVRINQHYRSTLNTIIAGKMMAMMNRLQQRNCAEVYPVTAMQSSRQVPILTSSSTNRQLE